MQNLFKIIFLMVCFSAAFTSCRKERFINKENLPKQESVKKQVSQTTDLSRFFEGYSGAFVLYDVKNNFYLRHNEEQCKKRLSPCSTFKIPNSLIALETGVAKDENFSLKWDGTKYSIESWNRDHNLKSAVSNSAVWYFRELARRIGEDSMKKYIEKINYGNKDITGGLDKFWLMGSIEISANEQVEFLGKLYKNELPFSERTTGIVKNILVLDSTDKYVLRGKTGSGTGNNFFQGWFVGYVTHPNGDAFIFASNVVSEKRVDGLKVKEITRSVLNSLKIM